MAQLDNDVTEQMDVVTHANEQKLVIRRTQDVAPFIEAAKKAQAEETSWRPFANPGEKMFRVASIPNIVVEKWLKEGFDIFDPDPAVQKKLMKRLSDPEWKYLRLYPGKLG